ncbi:MAG: helicase, partial [Helicobacter sp.]|nr:helicase [Helicobacter sp.]
MCIRESTNTKLILHNEVRAMIEILKFLETKNPLFKKEFFMLLGLREEALEDLLSFDFKEPAEILFALMKRFKIASLSAKKFLELVLEFSTIGELLAAVPLFQEDIVSSDFLGIRIMTIHKSKGLEFENVIVVDRRGSKKNVSYKLLLEGEEDSIEIKRIFKYPNNKEENLIRQSLDKAYRQAFKKEESFKKKDLNNQLYVALTRAKYTMQILYNLSKSDFEIIDLKDEERGDLETALKISSDFKDCEIVKESCEAIKGKPMMDNLGRQEKMQVIQKELLKKDNQDNQSISFGIALHFAMEQKLKNHLEDSLLLELLRNKEGFYLCEQTLQEILKKCDLLLKNPTFNEILQK